LLHAQPLRYEQTSTAHSEVCEGLVNLFGTLQALGLPTAFLANNHRTATKVALRKHSLASALVLTREDTPPNPARF
jgi:phosphoglycolate phosphatase-like HAD superfamily hydrolase